MYNIAIALYAFVVRLVSPFNKKAKMMLAGQKKTFPLLEKAIDKDAAYIWFHAASLGEFEQGRPLMEKIKKENPEYKILLTFFSPSGYEVRKNYPGADIVCYLPFDFVGNAIRLLELARPVMAIFIKYEFWMNYLCRLKKRNIPIYIISAIFRPNQIFFRWYGKTYRKVLKNFNWFFLQDADSEELLKKLNISGNITISGDTRFDRVQEICRQRKAIAPIDKFRANVPANSFTLVAGSVWEKDEAIILPYFNATPAMKLIIVPHEVDEEHLNAIISKLERPFVRYSQVLAGEIPNASCLIIDCIGLLSSIYPYGDVAYIGGGFGAGIHNILEAAVYGIPVLFGPNHHKFREAGELIRCGGGFSIAGAEIFAERMNEFSTRTSLLQEAGKRAEEYVRQNLGATNII
ncbi:MAG: 3-deoxy-D-manno-octulosonic acid transferase [Dysgonamonadaceae bacterium]|jgi:3-deoxy-D-manno-octulosonic-acid transferase|nr:3-deoxy-D-manno-octulosonic acid transferase [Dysgonamonadaceae bacterium]